MIKIGFEKEKMRTEEKGKNSGRGESLIESLISMFLIAVVIAPISDIFLKTYRLNVKVDRRNTEISENHNILELLRTKSYKEIEALEGEHRVDGISDFYTKFNIDIKYRIMRGGKEERDSKITIRKTENYYIGSNGQKEYIFEIYIDDIKSFYFPEI